MAAGQQQVTVTFAGNASGLQAAAAQVKQSLGNVKDAAKDMSAVTVAQGALVADAFKKIGSEALSFAKEALGSFQNVAKEVRSMTRSIGGSAEDMSKLRFAAEEVGVGADTLVRSFGLASTHFAKNDEAVKNLGISMKDAAGNVRPYNDVLGDISDRLNAMTDPYQKAAAARALFGRGYQEMLPLLGLGSEKMKEFGKEAEELGLVMSGKDLAANKNYNLAMKHLHATFEGLWVAVGRKLLPVFQWFVDTISSGVAWVKHLYESSAAVRGVLATVATVIGAVGAAAIIVIGVIKAWTVVQTILNAIMSANPIGLVIIAIVGLIAAVIALVKNFEPVGNAIIAVGEVIGTGIGWGINIALKAIKFLINGLSKLVDAGLAVAAFFAKLADSIAGVFGFDTGLEAKINGVRDTIKKATNIVGDTLDKWGEEAKNKGGELGKKFATAMVNAIKNLKMPSIATPAASGGEGPTLPPLPEEPAVAAGGGKGGGGKGGKSALQQRKDAIMQFFTDLVNSSRDALNAIRQAAADAQAEMRQIGADVAKSMSDAFSITDFTSKSFAEYLGGDSLVDFYRQRLTTMGVFVSNVKKLITMGLPREMLSDIVNAGVEGGAKAAAMLVANPGIMDELKSLQKQINEQTATFGAAYGEYMMSDTVASLTKQAQEAQTTYTGYLGTAQKIGYKPTAADLEAKNANITVNINATTQASPEAIAQAVAWALSTGTALGMKAAS